MLRHSALLFGRLQHCNQFVGKIFGISDAVETDRHIFVRRHIAEIRDVGAHDGNSVFTRLMGRTAGPGCGIVGHDDNAGCPEKFGDSFLGNVSTELNPRPVAL